MKNKKIEVLILVIIGLLIIGSGLFVYFEVKTIFPNGGSNRVQELNWLLKNFGRTGTCILFTTIGGIFIYIGFRIKK